MTSGEVTSEELARLPIGERVAYVRGRLKLTQVGFAKLIGVSDRTVKRWESSFIAPTREKAERIAAEAGLDPGLFYPDHTLDPEPDPVLAALTEMNERLAKMDDPSDGHLVSQSRLLAELAGVQESLQTAAEDLVAVASGLRREIDELAKQSSRRRPA